MRYQSFYPFAQNRGNDFFGTSNPSPQNAPTNSFDFWGGNQGAPQPPPAAAPSPAGPATNFFSQFQSAPTGGFQQGQPASKTMGYLQTADKFLNTAQQLTPMVRQFAPMIQNVPALLKLYRGFQSVPAATTAVAGASAASTAARSASTVASVTNGASLPRIFQPPI
ncbi:VrrA/YqfQ family protein [Psychrobacillus antarcticus]|uniref:VrrA/YqfQ family protein n=1 Tax=Psychrobacillus antarcticus TaxID=2879115 RepID=UPI0024086CB5|nr:VrrA/YqfQ family protein [Psychrobacillus antarcticus]